ncbi:receptor-type tyrosine-protein phosphatase alpha [Saccoglossus kowalevskii]|uniref:Receptor-type tyrosine-protein phosphatase alpha n=1 Tax=Saccoglossus kowalevskii TaxID=10224 RepID=A0ABM0MIH9_SACKO|nr:PREDICTED: receptor-type tyrosine-protein phosphatase alpha [Saccoglossus kowalevskii]
MRSYSQNKGRQNSAFINQDALYENAPTYPPIPAEQLPLVWATKHANDNDLLKKEYDDLPKSSKPVTVEASHIPENKIKNRYINILAYDQTRVKLTPIEDDPYSDYINACYVDGYKSHNKFIAAQGPKEETVNDFWRMIWEQKSLTIVMVTKCAESNREKCSQYWPDDCTTEYGDIKVTPLLKETIKLADYDIRSFSVCHLSDEEDTRTIIQLHYTSWPDFGAPKSPIGMLNFIKRARIIDQQHPSKPGPMLVHCSAGVGRTGTFIVLDAMMDQMAAEAKVDIFGFISQIRGQRNLLVQADVQYIFIYQALVEHYLYGNTEIDVNNMLIHWGKLHNRVPGTDKTGLEIEYQKLMEIPIENVVVKDAHSEHNRLKNRLVNVVPYDGNRFRLIRLLGREHSDYINASNIDGYRQKGAYVVTQGPLKDTVEDFWRLVWESRTGSIVMLCHLQENGLEKCTQYWPEDDETATYGDIAVQLKRNEDYSIYTIKTLLATDTKGGESRTIRHFHYTAWPEIGAPESGTGMIEMMGQIQKQQQNTGNLPILVHCSAGSGRSGAFCALNTVIERIKTEGIVDVFQTYKSLREQRPQIVQSVDQYNFVYKAVIDYLGSFDNYDNFK